MKKGGHDIIYLFFEIVSLYNPECPGTCSIDEGLNSSTDLPASPSLVLVSYVPLGLAQGHETEEQEGVYEKTGWRKEVSVVIIL